MSKPMQFNNSECISCAGVYKEMVRVGALIMCYPCFEAIFKTDDPVKLERETYLRFLNKYKQGE